MALVPQQATACLCGVSLHRTPMMAEPLQGRADELQMKNVALRSELTLQTNSLSLVFFFFCHLLGCQAQE